MLLKRCRICLCLIDPGKATEEDAYPKWLRKRAFGYFRAVPPDLIATGWEQGRRALLKPVCENCQRRLNTAFEIPARELLISMMASDSVLSLTERQQVILAGWFAKTALVLGLCSVDDNPAFLGRLRLALVQVMETALPLRRMTVRVGSVVDFSKAGHSVTAEPALVPDDWADQSRFWMSSVVSVPHLVFEVIGWTRDEHSRGFVAATQHDYAFVRVWPNPLPKARWPLAPLELLDVPALRQAWEHPAEALKNAIEVRLPQEPPPQHRPRRDPDSKPPESAT